LHIAKKFTSLGERLLKRITFRTIRPTSAFLAQQKQIRRKHMLAADPIPGDFC